MIKAGNGSLYPPTNLVGRGRENSGAAEQSASTTTFRRPLRSEHHGRFEKPRLLSEVIFQLKMNDIWFSARSHGSSSLASTPGYQGAKLASMTSLRAQCCCFTTNLISLWCRPVILVNGKFFNTTLEVVQGQILEVRHLLGYGCRCLKYC